MRSFTFSSKDHRILAFLLATALFVSLELMLNWVLPNPARDELQQYREQVLATPSTVQVMGDSAAYCGVSCEALASLPASEGKSFAMLAAPGTGPLFAYFVLKKQIENGVVPEAIVYLPSPHTFASSRLPKFVACYATWKEVWTAACGTRELADITYGLLCRGSYSLRYREELASLIRDRDLGALVRLGLASGNTDLGMASSEEEPGTKVFTSKDAYPSTYGKPFSVLPVNLWASQRFLELAAENRIPVFWSLMPVPQIVRESRARFDFDRTYEAYVASLCTGLSDADGTLNLLAVLQRPPVYGDDHFLDPTHLNPYGRKRFTMELADQLLPALSR